MAKLLGLLLATALSCSKADCAADQDDVSTLALRRMQLAPPESNSSSPYGLPEEELGVSPVDPFANEPGVYLRTQGYCRGGEPWPNGELWLCLEGSFDNAGCAAQCDANPECVSYDRYTSNDPNTCCLFKIGSEGNNQGGRECWINQAYWKPIFLIESVAYLNCLGGGLKVEDCDYSKSSGSQFWQLDGGKLLHPSSGSNKCLVPNGGSSLMIGTCSGAGSWSFNEHQQFAYAEGQSVRCLELGKGTAMLGECRLPDAYYLSMGRNTACRLNSKDESDDGEGFYRHVAVGSPDQCRSLCEGDPYNCKAYEYTEGTSRVQSRLSAQAQTSCAGLDDKVFCDDCVQCCEGLVMVAKEWDGDGVWYNKCQEDSTTREASTTAEASSTAVPSTTAQTWTTTTAQELGGAPNCKLWKQQPYHFVDSEGSECVARTYLGRDYERTTGVACRANTQDNTADGWGTVTVVQASSTEACKKLCDTFMGGYICQGYEFYMPGSGPRHCELWTLPIFHDKSSSSYECSVRTRIDQVFQIYPTPVSTYLTKVTYTPEDSLAKCQDGSPPAYYFRAATDASLANTWLFMLQGGGWCYDKGSCDGRSSSYKSSWGWSSSTNLVGIFSQGSSYGQHSPWRGRGSPLAGANLVYMRYCSSDGHMGDSSAWGYQFRGYRLVRSNMKHVAENRGMKAGDHLYFGGFSAGGRGAMAHLDTIHEVVPAGVKVIGVLDSPLWLEFDGFTKFSQQTKSASNLYVAREIKQPCIDLWGESDAWKCAFGQYRVPILKTNFLVIASQYDTHQLSSSAATWIKDEFSQLTRKILAGLGYNAAVFTSSCPTHAVGASWKFTQESVAGTKDAAANSVDLSFDPGYKMSMASALNATVRQTDVQGSYQDIGLFDTCYGRGCGQGCV